MVICGLLANQVMGEEVWSLDTQEEWKGGLSKYSGVKLESGQVKTEGEEGYLLSQLKKFDQKMSATSLLVKQSTNWLNWQPTANIGPKNLQDAPVLLSLGPNNYWMFGKYGSLKARGGEAKGKGKKAPTFVAEEASLEGFDIPLQTTPLPNQFNAAGGLEKGLGGYHAWQSRDMVNWVHHGAITETVSRWMTTAEYVDGKFYFYYDYPNDQDPHLYIDDDLTDGKPGTNMGIAFEDPTNGSDCAFIRDAEGKFHVIYEDWSHIDASKRSWDSPVAGHAVSADGIKDFEILKPVVDVRTKPTGKTATYRHPHWKKENPEKFKTNVGEYEVHEPEQEAFGDWASIAIGEQYYLFGDYDPVGGHQMSVGFFTSEGIEGPFEWCGNVGKGHPDPDICFAEGKFYLATQQDSDFVSPGPWVETVEVRVGVDTDNDSQIDQWTDWQDVQERYDYTPGFAKQIAKKPALLDLSSLPEGYGFQFEIKLTDTTENDSSPVLEELEFVLSPSS